MSKPKQPSLPTAASIKSCVSKNAARVRKLMSGHHHGAESVRAAEYKGHHIEVKTSYEVTVDGRAVTGHLGVSDDGAVHYHPIPNLSFASALDLVKMIIDVFPDDFKKRGKAPKRPKTEPHHHH